MVMMKKITAVIVEDEVLSRNYLKRTITETCKNVEVVGIAGTFFEAITYIDKLKPDLVFLDLRLDPDKFGFEILEKTRYKDYKVIITSAYPEYMLKAWDFNTIYYLLKPIGPDKIMAAINKYESYFSINDNDDKISLPYRRNNIPIIRINDIIYIEADENLTNFYLAKEVYKSVSRRLNKVYPDLPKQNFHRIHKKYIVNLNYVDKYERTVMTVTGADLHIKEGSFDGRDLSFKQTLPISYRNLKEFKKKMNNFLNRSHTQKVS
jgi:two-component system, LytTR family, response regulator